MRIHILDEATIARIAAGEVIERPASVVKELIENAIDAGSDEISVEIMDGGKQKIIVTDNGTGIREEDLPLSIERHATSKITQFEDLYQTKSLGFRGEALASIAAISKLTARSRTEEQDLGLELVWEGGEKIDQRPLAMAVGTQMIVEALFYSLPVRRDFLRTAGVEGNHVARILYAYAVGHPEISFRFSREGKRIFQTDGRKSAQENLLILFGSAYYEALLPLQGKSPHYQIHGYMGNNTFYRGNRQMELIYMNGRYIEDEPIREALEHLYQSVIPNGRYPAFQVYIETDARHLEVNIHPNKQIIRYDYPEELLDLITKSGQETLFHRPRLPEASEPKKATGLFSDLSSEEAYQAILDRYHWPDATKGRSHPVETISCKEAQNPFSFFTDEEIAPPQNEEASYQADLFVETLEESERLDRPDLLLDPAQETSDLPAYDDLTYVGSLFRTYLIFEDRTAPVFYLIDQHAAHERVNYERFSDQLKKEKVSIQPLLNPLTLHLTDLQWHAFEERQEALAQLGFSCQVFGATTLLVRAVPSILASEGLGQHFLDLLDFPLSKDPLDAMENRDRLAMKACKASVKQGDALTPSEVEALYQQLRACRYPFTCPHGRPTILRRYKKDLEQIFLRRK